MRRTNKWLVVGSLAAVLLSLSAKSYAQDAAGAGGGGAAATTAGSGGEGYGYKFEDDPLARAGSAPRTPRFVFDLDRCERH